MKTFKVPEKVCLGPDHHLGRRDEKLIPFSVRFQKDDQLYPHPHIAIPRTC